MAFFLTLVTSLAPCFFIENQHSWNANFKHSIVDLTLNMINNIEISNTENKYASVFL